MFVLRYLVIGVLLILAAVAWGVGQHYSVWQILGLAFGTALALQAAVVLLVAIMALHPHTARKQHRPRRTEHLAIASK